MQLLSLPKTEVFRDRNKTARWKAYLKEKQTNTAYLVALAWRPHFFILFEVVAGNTKISINPSCYTGISHIHWRNTLKCMLSTSTLPWTVVHSQLKQTQELHFPTGIRGQSAVLYLRNTCYFLAHSTQNPLVFLRIADSNSVLESQVIFRFQFYLLPKQIKKFWQI